MIKQKQYEKLIPYKHHLGTAFKANYYRGITGKELSDLNEVYKEIFGTNSHLTNGCSHCILADLQKLGKEFFAYDSALQSKANSVPDEVKQEKKLPKEKTVKTNKNKKK